MSNSTGGEKNEDDDKWDGDNTKLEDFDKMIARWCRKKWGTIIGNMIWENDLPKLEDLQGAGWDDHATEVWNSIDESDSTRAKFLWHMDSGFWSKSWHRKWRKQQYDKLFDKVESCVNGMAAMEVATLGMENAALLRSHLTKQFGGAGEDVQARQDHYEAGMPKSKGGLAFPPNVNVPNKLRELEAERVALWKMCPPSKRDEYEYGKQTTLVKIVLRHLRTSEYSECIKSLLQEIKIRREIQASLPVFNEETGRLELPEKKNIQQSTEDWDYRNYNQDWLPSWDDLKSKLTSVWKERQFAKPGTADDVSLKNQKKSGSNLPVMFMPGAGLTPKFQCFGCGQMGHRKGDPECTAGPNDWHECCPPKFLERVKKLKRKGIDGMSKKKNSDGICRSFRDTGKCRFGAKCKFKHITPSSAGEPPRKKGKSTKGKGKNKVTFAMVRSLAAGLKQHAKEKEESNLSEEDLSDYLKSLMTIRTVPRQCNEKIKISIANLSSIELIDVSRHACYDSGSGTGISTCKEDFVWLDESSAVKESVEIRGPSVGGPECAGRGALVFRCVIGRRQYGIVHPNGVFAESELKFRVLSERVNKARGLRLITGEFDQPDELECVRSKSRLLLKTQENILVMETSGSAKDIVDSHEFRQAVKEIEQGKRSPLLNLEPFLDDGGLRHESVTSERNLKNSVAQESPLLSMKEGNKLNVAALVFNESKATPEERARLWSRRLAYCDTAKFAKMASMPEYGDFPKLPQLNEDSLIADQSKFKRKSFQPNDPALRMDCPPWWRVYFDGYGGQKSLGGESYEGAVGSYIFVCCATGSLDVRLYASHEQFPVALHQFLRRVEAEHYKVHMLYGDTFSVNLSEDVEEVCALFQCNIQPVSAGTPQEMAFAESMVRVVKRMSTALLVGAPHVPQNSWALADKYAVFIHDFLPQSTREGHCPYYLRTGRKVNWKVLPLHVFGSPCAYAPIEGPIHKRAPITKQGHFMGVQWPAVLIKRTEDDKIISCAKQKMRAYEKVYTVPLDQALSRITDGEGNTSGTQRSQDEEVTPGVRARSSGGGELNHRVDRPQKELSKNRVQSIKSMREHQFQIPGKRHEPESKIESSAMQEAMDCEGEGIYVDEVCSQDSYHELTSSIQKAIKNADSGLSKPSIRQQVLHKLKAARDLANGPAPSSGGLKIGKRKASSDITSDNIVKGKRTQVRAGEHTSASNTLTQTGEVTDAKSNIDSGVSMKKGRRGRKPGIKVGDLVSLPSSHFDGKEPGSFSDDHPDPCLGKVKDIKKNGLTLVHWIDDDDEHWVKIKDLTLEVKKRTTTNIIVMLVEGAQIAFEAKDKHKYPKNFFEVLVKKDWREWVASVKKELSGWDANNAVSVVPIEDVPKNAKIVPLGELYSIKRDGRYKFRQYLMGNLLRDGIDFDDTFSTTVSEPGICIFYSIATTCRKPVWGWDAICGYLQAKEQFDVFAFLPSHHGYSDLEYEELAILRKQFVNLLKSQGEEGLKKFAARHRRDSRTNPKEVYKLNSSIYGNAGAGHEFEMLIQSVHIQTCGCTQTEPEPSIYIRVVANSNDEVTGYVIAAAYTDDIRFFGTEPERVKYIEDVKSRLKVTISTPPVCEFVSIETYQCLVTDTIELKMPKYFDKAASGFKDLFPEGMKDRKVPLTTRDEELMKTTPTPAEVEAAKHLPFRNLLGVLSYPASKCKMEMKYAISVCGSRRGGWNAKQFEVVKRVLEYGFYTRHLGLMYSKGLDPHGDNVCYAYGDAGLQVPRSYGCRIVMLNGAAISFKAKRQTVTAPSTVWSEMITFFDTTQDVAATRNLLAELGMYQEHPSTIYGDNEAQQLIANNRGSMGPTSRAMSLKTLSARNRIEDHEVKTEWIPTEDMVADIGTKSIPHPRFAKLRDVMNGYALVKAAYPNKEVPAMVNDGKCATLAETQSLLLSMTTSPT